MKIPGIILAAGASVRMGQPKALLTWDNQFFIDRIIAVFDLPIDPVIVVVRDKEDIPCLKARQMGKYAKYVVNPEPDRGQLSSLQCGLAAAPYADAFAFCPIDYPAIRPDTMKELIRAFETSGALVIVPRFESRHGHPVIVRRSVADELLAASPTGTARDVLHRFADRTRYVPVKDPGVVADVDTPEDYAALRKKFGVH